MRSKHVERARLLRRLTAAHLVLIEAGGGFGKSVLAAQLRRRVETASAVVELERDTDEPDQLVGAMRRGLRRAGLSDIASASTAPPPMSSPRRWPARPSRCCSSSRRSSTPVERRPRRSPGWRAASIAATAWC